MYLCSGSGLEGVGAGKTKISRARPGEALLLQLKSEGRLEADFPLPQGTSDFFSEDLQLPG